MLFAESRKGGKRNVLLVLQAMDTAGKGGIVRHVVGSVDPQGVKIHGFKAPTDEEKQHDFLWRVRKQLPPPGIIGVFDRSHYEEVLIGRVRKFNSPETIEKYYGVIMDFEKELIAGGTHDHQGHAPHQPGRAEGAAAGAARPSRQVLEVQPRRHRRAQAVAGLHGGVPTGDPPHLDRCRRLGT